MTLEATIARNDLLAALKWTGIAVPKRPQMQVLLGVRLIGAGSIVMLAAFDYEVVATDTVSAPGARGEALVPHRQFVEMITALPKGCDVRLDVVSGDRLRIVAADTRYMLPLMPLADYPALPEVAAPAATALLNGDQWRRLLKPCVAVGRDDTLPVLTGLLLDAPDGTLCSAATDRYRLGVQNLDIPWAMSKPVLVPASILTQAARLLGSKIDYVTISTTEVTPAVMEPTRFTVASGTRSVRTRVLDGEFPKYRPLIPADEDATYRLDIPRADLLGAVERVRVAGARLAPTRITLQGGDTLLVEAGTDVSSDSYAAAEVHGVKVLKGDTVDTIGLNVQYLRDGLGAFDDDVVTVSSVGGRRPHIFRADGQPGWTYLLMPVALKEG